MSVNPYEESFLDTLKNNKLSIIKGLIVLLLLLGIFGFASWYFQKDTELATTNELIRGYNYSKGNKDAKVKVVYYFDYECSACQQNEPVFQEFTNQLDPDVAVYVKHLPIIGGPYSQLAAEATQAAGLQGKFFEFKAESFKRVQSSLNAATLTQIATDLGLDVEKWNQDRGSREIKNQVEQDIKDVQTAQVPPSSRDQSTTPGRATPGYMIIKDDKVVEWWSGALPLEELKTRVNGYKN